MRINQAQDSPLQTTNMKQELRLQREDRTNDQAKPTLGQTPTFEYQILAVQIWSTHTEAVAAHKEKGGQPSEDAEL